MRSLAISVPAKLSGPARRVFAWALLAAIPLLVWEETVAPVLDGIAQSRHRTFQARATLARYDALIAQVPALEARLAALDKAALAGREPIEGSGTAQAGAKLQSDLQRLAGSAGVAVRGSQIQPSPEEAGFLRIGVVLDLSADAPGLQRLLHGIESAQPPLFVTELVVHAPDPGGAPGPGGQPMLGVRCQIVLYAPVKPESKTNVRADK